MRVEGRGRPGRLELAQVWTLYAHEMRCALRERSIVVFSVIIPLVLYPGLLWAGLSALSVTQGQAERIHIEVGALGVPAEHPLLLDSLRAGERVEVREWVESPEAGHAAVRRGDIDLFLEFLPPTDAAASLEGNFRVRVAYHGARDRSRSARARMASTLGAYRTHWIDEARRDLGVQDRTWTDFTVVRNDLTTAEEGTRFLLALIVPFLTLLVVALAAFYPAIDATAGERERSTWETLMTVASPRINVAAAKYLHVATFGAVGGLLNVAALVLSLRWIFEPVLGAEADELLPAGIPPEAFLAIVGGTILLSLFVAAGMMVFAVFARSFKEGQSMITPFYVAVILPAVLLQAPDIELTPMLALVPVANVCLLIREAIMGGVPPLEASLTLASMVVSVTLAILLGQWILGREEVTTGSSKGGLGAFLRRRLVQGRRG